MALATHFTYAIPRLTNITSADLAVNPQNVIDDAMEN